MASSKVAGVDFSTRAIDVVLLDDTTDTAVWHSFPQEGRTAFERAHDVRLVLPQASWWEAHTVALIAVEEPRGWSNPVTQLALGSLYGAIVARLPRGIPAVAMTPAEWKKPFTGNGNAPKPLVRARAVELGFGDAPDLPTDAYDAFGIAHAARTLNRLALGRAA